jgi:glycerol-3-phosphate dehydrogenase
VYVGTTDTTQRGAPELWPQIEPGDVDYVLEALPRHFGIDPVAPSEVFSAWAGLRPLVARAGKSPSQLSRRDEIAVGPGRLISVAGGKLTGYRPLSESILSRAAGVLGHALPPAPPEEPLPGGTLHGSLERCAARLQEGMGVCAAAAERLVRLYGSEAQSVALLGREPIAPGAPLLLGEIDWAVQSEAAASLEDVFYRRTRAALYEPGADRWIEPMAARMAKLLAWTDARRTRELERVQGRVRGDLAFRERGPGAAPGAC